MMISSLSNRERCKISLKKVLKSAGIADANFHALRHTFATRCIELGFDVKSLSEILGHATVNITMNRYVHPTYEMKKGKHAKAF
ncbi:MAG: tyrosine-type recombinase/integrase [Coprococcus sp.]